MSLLDLAIIVAVVAALAAIPRRTRKPAILTSSLAILASLTAAAYANARVAKPALAGSGPLALVVPTGLIAPDYHEPEETWRAEHFAYVQASEAGEAECLGCHAAPEVFCNRCHNYAGVSLIAAPLPTSTPTAPTRTPEAAIGTPTAEATEETASAPSFSRDVQPLLNRRCAACHGVQAGLSVASVADLLNGGLSGPAILPGDAEGSLLVRSLRGTLEGSERMPMGSTALTEAEIDLIGRWIQAGAQDN